MAVYDGHGGSSVAKHAAETLHEIFSEQLQNTDCTSVDICNAFRYAYSKIDSQVLTKRALLVGATAVTAYVDSDASMLVVANAGDSRAVLGDTTGAAHRLTVDHRPSLPSEKARVRAAGAFVFSDRVNGSLAVSRALGDHCMKSAVICTPALAAVRLQSHHRFLILACDGLWDVIDDEMATKFVANLLNASVPPSPVAISRALVRKALEAGTTDNVSVIVTLFHRQHD